MAEQPVSFVRVPVQSPHTHTHTYAHTHMHADTQLLSDSHLSAEVCLGLWSGHHYASYYDVLIGIKENVTILSSGMKPKP